MEQMEVGLPLAAPLMEVELPIAVAADGQEWRLLRLPGAYLQYYHCARLLGRGFKNAADGRSRAERADRPRSYRFCGGQEKLCVPMGDPVCRTLRRSVVRCLPGCRHAGRAAGAGRGPRQR